MGTGRTGGARGMTCLEALEGESRREAPLAVELRERADTAGRDLVSRLAEDGAILVVSKDKVGLAALGPHQHGELRDAARLRVARHLELQAVLPARLDWALEVHCAGGELGGVVEVVGGALRWGDVVRIVHHPDAEEQVVDAGVGLEVEGLVGDVGGALVRDADGPRGVREARHRKQHADPREQLVRRAVARGQPPQLQDAQLNVVEVGLDR